MTDEFREKRQPIASDVTDEEIARLIEQRKRAGAISCSVQVESGKRVLVCRYKKLNPQKASGGLK